MTSHLSGGESQGADGITEKGAQRAWSSRRASARTTAPAGRAHDPGGYPPALLDANKIANPAHDWGYTVVAECFVGAHAVAARWAAVPV